MKKISLFAVVLIATSFASCKKNWNCVCTNNSNGTTETYVSAKLSKKDAKTWCETGNSSGYSCAIK